MILYSINSKFKFFDLKYIGLGILKISSKNKHALEVERPVFQALYLHMYLMKIEET